MSLVLLILLLSLIFLFWGLPVFETVFSLFLLTQVFSYLLGSAEIISTSEIGSFGNLYYSVLGFLVVFFLLITRESRKKFSKTELLEEGFVMVLFIAFFGLAYVFCLLWPDFIAIGERLRDYAILASVINSPIEPREPWMSGYVLNYYLFWYRIGHMLSAMFDLKPWAVYHQLQSFTFALYLTCGFRFLRKYLKFSTPSALIASLIIGLGSNVAGVVSFVNRDDNWWGPSRVIEGAIDEFPAWSFVLGDAHPHYLNLGLVPFFILIILSLGKLVGNVRRAIPIVLGLVIIPPIWVYNGNAWEVPIWLGIAVLIGAFLLVLWLLKLLPDVPKSTEQYPLQRVGALISLVCFAIVSLVLSSRNISPGDDKLTFVAHPIPGTRLSELLLHWGFPLTLVALSCIFLIRNKDYRLIAVLTLLSTLLVKESLSFLSILLLINLGRIWLNMVTMKSEGRKFEPGILMVEIIGVASLGLCMTPEIIYLNDPYGPEIDRMNTIFKIYSANWFLVHIFAFYLTKRCYVEAFSEEARERIGTFPIYLVQGSVALLLLGFFVRTAWYLRKLQNFSVLPKVEGLSEIENRFPGSAATIRHLRDFSRGVVLETQGNAYDYTSFVSTLSGHDSYLGWKNHNDLLVKNYDESGKREKTTDEFYREGNCEKRRETLTKEGIQYAVVGVLEKQKYQEIPQTDFSCLKKIFEEKEYTVYSP